MDFKRLTADMTEQALCILMALAPSGMEKELTEIASRLEMRSVEVEFILQQLVEFKIVNKGQRGRYLLTSEYMDYVARHD